MAVISKKGRFQDTIEDLQESSEKQSKIENILSAVTAVTQVANKSFNATKFITNIHNEVLAHLSPN